MTVLSSAAIGALEVQVQNAQQELYQIRLALATMMAEAKKEEGETQEPDSYEILEEEQCFT